MMNCKRRLRQKYEFIAQDLASLSEPSEEDLRAFYNEKFRKSIYSAISLLLCSSLYQP